MKKVIASLLIMALLLPLVSNPVLAANVGNKGNNGKSEKAIEKSIENVNENKEKVGKNDKKQLSESIDADKKNELKDKLQNKEVSKQEFKDTKDHWANKAIETSKSLGWMKGYPDGTFKPQELVSTDQIIEIAMNLAVDLNPIDEELEEVEIEEAEEVEDGDDEVDEEPAKEKVINVNRFHSQVQATRAQAAVTLAKALELKPVDTTESNFADNDLILAEDLGYILALLDAGVITGTPDGKFNPNSSITRGEIATMLANIAAKVVEEPEELEVTDTDEEVPPSIVEGL